MCEPGSRPDVAFRIPALFGPLDAPRGTGCDFVDAPAIAAAAVVCGPATLLSLYVWSFEIYRWSTKTFDAGRLLTACTNVAVAVVFSVGALAPFYFPTRGVWVWTLCVFLLVLAMANMLNLVVATLYRILFGFGAAADFADFMGSRVVAHGLIIAWVCTSVVIVISSFLASFYATDDDDMTRGSPKASVAWAVSSLSSGVMVFVAFCLVFVFVGKFVDKVGVLTAAHPPNDASVAPLRKMASKLAYFRYVLVIGFSPGGIAMWVVHATVLPLYWYAYVFHWASAVNGCLILWFAITPPRRIQRRFWFLKADDAKPGGLIKQASARLELDDV